MGVNMVVMKIRIMMMSKMMMAAGYLVASGSIAFGNPAFVREQQAAEVLEHYCFDCHGDGSEKGG
ncbi:MAG TPA: hypothetical protein DEP88_03620, partial [Verrucomicrobiales bacterium]|nr:hypothetical protein [Verrucomicrobiales bacterium]